ncbi:DUF1566 domain-containing protein [Leptospira semungkisensis]|uniref:DUF1566 domain-containing protein n=1 Tax=Leptospira semungkisensis TaxID=2484985 RepID=A0A4R9FQN9_9LEPT|nr:DUF1566 domain-containing protein [Leptospira semungkisensis]TGK00823.1 DUF1566 domain-containing protein [Leptospira semungkisensis]
MSGIGTIFTVRYSLFTNLAIVFFSLSFFSCSPNRQNYSLLSALEQMIVGLIGGSGGGGGIITPPGNGLGSFTPGESINLNNSSGPTVNGVIIDPSGSGKALGISTQGNGVPNLIFLYPNNSSSPNAVDINGDGAPDYYLCYLSNGSVNLTTGSNCSGNTVTIYPNQGFDINGDGVVDNPMIARLAADVISPSSSISPNPGSYGGVQIATIVCADNVAPGNIAYTIDGSTPAYSPQNGTITNPPKTTVTIGGNGDGTYAIKYRCRDLAGNIENVNTASYVINHNIPNVSIVTPASSFYLSSTSGAVQTASYVWKSTQVGSYSIRQNATGCTDGNVIESGMTGANQNNTSFISANQLSVGPNSIFICVNSGLVGQISFTITRDDTKPVIAASPGAGGYGYDGVTPVSIQLAYADNINVSSGYQMAYTTDGSTPAINSLTGAITNGNSFPPPAASTIDLISNTNLQFIARDPAGNLSLVGSAAYVIDSSRPTIQVNGYTPSNQVIDGSTAFGINWQFSGTGASYKVLLGGNRCTASTVSSIVNGVTVTKNVYSGPSGARYSNTVDCECNNGSTPTGTSTFISGNVVTGTASNSDIKVNTAVNTSLANLNFTAGKNSLIICVGNQANQPEYGMQTGSQTINVWKDTQAPLLVSATPSGGATDVNPNPGKLTLVFSEPLDPTSTPNLTVQVFQYGSWATIDTSKAKFQFLASSNQPDTLVIWLPSIFFPENALIQWSIAAGTLKDAASLALASTITQSFLTTTYEVANTYAPPILRTGTGEDLTFGDAKAQNLSNTVPGGLWSNSYPTDLVVFDYNTKLVWKKDEENLKTDFFSAINGCANLNIANSGAGYATLTNWRLPSAQELATLSIYDGSSPSIASASVFGSLNAAPYWTSTLFTPTVTNAWYVDFQYPDLYFGPVTASNWVRCVSGVPGSNPLVP